jgi:hypothetical protein
MTARGRALRAGVAVCAVALTASAGLAGSALAYAGTPPDVMGKKYGDASSTLTNAGFDPVVSTTVGDRKAWSDCLVSNVQTRAVPPPENSSGTTTNEALVSLNCDADEASSKVPGYSSASPEGQAIAAEKKAEKDKAAQEKTATG